MSVWLTGVIAEQWNPRHEPFYFLAIVVVLALLVSITGSEIAPAHDWQIDVTSSDADGARFEITGVQIEA